MKDSIGACIALLAAHPPEEKNVSYENVEIIEMARKWRMTDGKTGTR
jgi:hypothetical protein